MTKNNSGIILLTVLWVLAILSLLALSLSKNASLEVALIRNSVGKLKAYAAARAGINYAQSLLAQNKTETDTLYQCGIKLPDSKTPQGFFKKIKVGEGAHFDMVISGAEYGLASSQVAYGLEDEQGKINLNAMDGSSYKVFSKLLQQFNVNNSDADDIAAAVIDWHSDTTDVFKDIGSSVKGAKDNYYAQLSVPYKCKNKPFDRVEELLLVRGMTTELFMKIKNYITVFPKDVAQGFKINFNTASDPVLRATVEVILDKQGGSDLVQALIKLRNGEDRTPFTFDDGVDKISSISASQQLYINSLKSNQGIERSEFFRIRCVGTDEATRTKSIITAVIYRSLTEGHVSVVAWFRE